MSRTAEGTVPSSNNANNALDRDPPTLNEVRDTPITSNHGDTDSPSHLYIHTIAVETISK